jgi:hypothetical protein
MREVMIAMGLISLAIGCGSGVFAPNEGEWEIGEFVSDDACGSDIDMYDDTGSAPETVELTMDKDGNGFTILSEDDSTTHCTLSAKDFECELPDEADTETSLEEYGLDATIYFDVSVTGAFSSQTAGKLSSTADISCEGENCDAVEAEFGGTLPCTTGADAPLSAL